jgi:hypothetical protein
MHWIHYEKNTLTFYRYLTDEQQIYAQVNLRFVSPNVHTAPLSIGKKKKKKKKNVCINWLKKKTFV